MIFLHSSDPRDIRMAAALPFVAGISASPRIVAGTGGTLTLFLKALCDTGRRDWKVFVHLPAAGRDELLRHALEVDRILAELTGGRLAGPTLVCRLDPTPDSLFAASRLIREGLEVCITGVTNPLQAMAVAHLPKVDESEDGPHTTLGPPDARMPFSPHFIRIELADLVQPLDVLSQVNAIYASAQTRTRILVGSIDSHDEAVSILGRVAQSGANSVIDLALQPAIIQSVLATASLQPHGAGE